MTRQLCGAVTLLLGLAFAAPSAAQGPALSRLPDGQPNVQGVWEGAGWTGNAGHSLEDGCCDAEHNAMQRRAAANRGLQKQVIIEPANGRIPFQPWAMEKRREHLINLEAPTAVQHVEPEDRCALQGVPRSQLRGPMQILQTPGQVVILYEWVHAYRVIPVDGRPHAPKGTVLWQGDSRGRWEGNTLVVEVTNFRADTETYNKQPWLDSHGTFYSDALKVTERWNFVSPDLIEYQARIEDPKVFTQPWTIAFPIERVKEPYEFIEEACWEGVRIQNRLDAGRLAIKQGNVRPHSHSER